MALDLDATPGAYVPAAFFAATAPMVAKIGWARRCRTASCAAAASCDAPPLRLPRRRVLHDPVRGAMAAHAVPDEGRTPWAAGWPQNEDQALNRLAPSHLTPPGEVAQLHGPASGAGDVLGAMRPGTEPGKSSACSR